MFTIGSQGSRRYTAGSNKERRNGGGSSVSNFLERFSSKKKIDETESKSRTEKKRSGRSDNERKSRDKRNERRKNKQQGEQNDNERNVPFSLTNIVPYREPSRTESDSGRANQGFSKDSSTMFDDDEISL